MPEGEFKWLHLTDLHVGMSDQDWLWPTLKHSFYADIEALHSTIGSWDLVLFSGDLTQRGTADEYEKLDTVLAELWGKFKSLGFAPKLITLPGNHDVHRATSLSPELRLLRKWWDEPDIHQEFFGEKPGVYRSAIEEVFKPYNTWLNNKSPNIEKVTGGTGILPGDGSFVIQKGDIKVGVVTLNSAWLQIDDSEYEEKLHVDTRQLLRVTNSDPHAWCTANHFNIIATHHPFAWLHHNSRADWLSEINPPGRFDLHVFGHMHEASLSSVSSGGSQFRTSLQGASMFGLASTKKVTERLHGYSIAKLTLNQGQRDLRLWPRKLRKIASGERTLGPDFEFKLAQDNSVAIFINNSSPPSTSEFDILDGQESLAAIADESREVLKKVRFQLPFSPAHANVRKIEQQKLLEVIADKRTAWVVAEWGLGEDGFLSSVCQIKGLSDRPVYRLDLADFRNREQFLETIREELGCSFQQFCELVSQSGDCFLLLDNFPAGALSSDAGQSADRQVESLIHVVSEYAPNAFVLIQARRNPLYNSFPIIELRSLDEADMRTYVMEHERGRAELATASAIGLLLRHTDGIPTQIDRALKDLEVITLSELVNIDSDVTAAPLTPGGTSPALIKSILDFSASTDPTEIRSFALLKVLSLFPQGEQLTRIKRFNSTAPFFPAHATELLDRALIEVTTTQGLGTEENGSLAKTLVVPRPIRECIRDRLDSDEVISMNRRAAEIYFGPQWTVGTYKFPRLYKFDEPHCGSADIANANTIIFRLLKEAVAQEEHDHIARVLGLAEFYLGALKKGDHYQSAAIFCDDFVPLIPVSGFEGKRAAIRLAQAASLRMAGEEGKSKSILLDLMDFSFSNSDRQSLLVDLALCLESLGEKEEAKQAAEKAAKIDRHSFLGLQARSTLIELNEDDPERKEKLARLEITCRKEGALVVANNIAILRARDERKNHDRVREILLPVVKQAKDKSDTYNKMRASIELAELSLKAGEKLSESDLRYLVGSYHFLFNERLPGLFDRCHDSLWISFDRSDDTSNLLSLFRHSSLYWRLIGSENREKRYLSKLVIRVGSAISQKLSTLGREVAYYLVRAAAQAVPGSTKE